MLALGWRGSARHWQRYENGLPAARRPVDAAGALGALGRQLRLRGRIFPGWHATIFPPYFVAGAIYAGFAMVLTLAIPLRAALRPQDFITMRHLENMAKVMLVTGLIVVYGYMMEVVLRLVQREPVRAVHDSRTACSGRTLVLLGADLLQRLVPQLLWFKKLRTNVDRALRHVAVRQRRHVARALRHHRHELHRDFLPSSWGMYYPTIWDFSTLFGTIGLFLTLMFLFVRVLPMISIFEMRTLRAGGEGQGRGRRTDAHATTSQRLRRSTA